MEIDKVCKSMPKVELHAHLNGCISSKTLERLMIENSQDPDTAPIQLKPKTNRTLSECFGVFKLIHDIVRTPETLRRVTVEVINDFADENVIYLELRTTAKAIHQITSKSNYLDSVIAGIKDCKENIKSIAVKLLISIDREKGEAEACENVDLAIEYSRKYPDIVVGMDLSGNPTTGNIDWILPLLSRAKEHGLSLACHLPEVLNLKETDRLLEFDGIGRFGHGLFLHPTCGGTVSQWETIKKKQIPIEACITSNLVSGVTESLEKHYVRALHEERFPFILCTDDSGLFNTTLSEEYVKFLQIVPLTLADLQVLCLDSASYAFCSEVEKCNIRKTILNWWSEVVELK